MSNIEPIEWLDKVNSPELLAFLQQYGEENYLTAEQINEIKTKVNLMIQKSNSGPYEPSENKSTFVTDADSNTKFPVWSAITLWVKEKYNAALPSKNSMELTDVFITGDNSDNGKIKKITLLNFLSFIKGFFQTKDTQVEVNQNSNVLNSWHGQTVLFTASCTITVPSLLNESVMFPFRTLAGVSVTWVITSPFVWENTPTVTPEKKVGHFMRRGSTNLIMLDQ